MSRKHTQTIRDWYPVLKWPRLPNFGNCHNLETPDIASSDYYADDKIISLIQNLFISLNENKGHSLNIRLTGNPGAGKTSFLYHLKRLASKGHVQMKDFCFYIFHINRADPSMNKTYYEEEILTHVKRAWKTLFVECNRHDEYQKLREKCRSNKELVNALTSYFKKNKPKFNKILIFVVDDVDLLKGSDVALVSDSILKNIECASVQKWISIRHVTYDNYDAKTKKRIEEFFPAPMPFPDISLSALMNHRIKTVCQCGGINNFKNPFSESLCNDIVKPICEGNFRECLSILKYILEDNPPGELKVNTDEVFIQNYLEKAAISSFLDTHKLLNLHADIFRVNVYPVAIDILNCAQYHQSEGIIYAAANECMNERDRSVLLEENIELRLSQANFLVVVKQLEAHELLTRNKSQKSLNLTPKGKIHTTFVRGKSYIDQCKSREMTVSKNDSNYWLYSARSIDHEKIVRTFQQWRT